MEHLRPGKVRSRNLRPVLSAELLAQCSTRRRILGVDSNKAICVFADDLADRAEGVRAGVDGTNACGGVELLEEGERDGSDSNGRLPVPLP
jgi:hypothetical protein